MTTIIECNSDVERPNSPLPESSPKCAIEHLIKSPVEACSEYAGPVVSTWYHSFMAAIHSAFIDHRPLVLSPDMIWLLIAQGFANHLNMHADEMRGQFVSHDGKKRLDVRRDDFVKGSLENPWEHVFAEFSTHVRNEVGESNHNVIVAEFTTTGAIEKAANEVVLMESMKPYFGLSFQSLCGIPEVRLEGSHEDWKRLAQKTEVLGSTYGVQWWTDCILPKLETMAAHSNGKGDPAFWRDIYKWNETSGGPYVNGWIVDFIPYIAKRDGLHENSLIGQPKDGKFSGITLNTMPSGLSKVPFTWDYHGTNYEMEFVAGFTSFTQEKDSFAVRPKIGWAVRDKE